MGGVKSECAECHQKHSKCSACKGYHKCTTKCNLCKKFGHIKNCCPKMLSSLIAAAAAVTGGDSNDAVAEVETEEEVAFGFVVTVGDQQASVDALPNITPGSFSVHAHQISTHLLSHMECEDASFHVAKPAKAPLIRVSCKLLVANHAVFGRGLAADNQMHWKSVKISGLADTGAQVCTGGPIIVPVPH